MVGMPAIWFNGVWSSVMNSAIAGYNSVYLEVVITVFMLLFGVNFYCYYDGLLLARLIYIIDCASVRGYILRRVVRRMPVGGTSIAIPRCGSHLRAVVAQQAYRSDGHAVDAEFVCHMTAAEIAFVKDVAVELAIGIIELCAPNLIAI